MTQSDPPDVIEALTRDHQAIATMLGEVRAGAGLTGVLIATLVRHAVAEEEYVYPAVREQVADGERVADRGMAQHAQIEETLQQLAAATGRQPRQVAGQLLAALAEEVRRHLRHDETELFPRLRRACTRSDLARLGGCLARLGRTATPPAPSYPADQPALVDQVRAALATQALPSWGGGRDTS